MEVHTHTHTARKKWTHYLWEFIMLFLAVFCGFLAEYKLEHTIEHQRAKEYAQSLYRDLQNDTADIRKATLYESRVVASIDSLVDFISSPMPFKNGGTLYYYMRFGCWRYNVDWNKATLNQLINSGNLRYFTNTELVTQISRYNTLSAIVIQQDNMISDKRDRAVAYKDRIAIARYEQAYSTVNMDDVISGRKSVYIDSLRNTDMPIQANSAELLNAFANALVDTKNNRHNLQTKHYPNATKLAVEIMGLLKKEYHLK